MTTKPSNVGIGDAGDDDDIILDTKDANIGLFPQGHFVFNTLSAERRTTQKGDPQLMVKLAHVRTIESEEDVAEGRVLVLFLPLIGGGIFKTAQFGAAVGLEGQFKPSTLIAAIERGATIETKITHRPSKDDPEKVFVDTKDLKAVGGGKPSPVAGKAAAKPKL